MTRVLADPDAEGSPLLRDRSLSWHFLALDVAFADLRALGAARRGAITLTTPCASDERVRAGPTALRFA